MAHTTRDTCRDLRSTWENCIGNQKVRPKEICNPASRQELVAIVRQGIAEKRKVRAVGSGHSFSDVALTEDYLINTHCLNRVLAVDAGIPLLLPISRAGHLAEVECGIRIRDLNRELRARGLALENMGGYDAQTIMGVISTGTHGSGITLGAIHDSVRSIDIVDSTGTICRVEPGGERITDPAEFAKQRPGDKLIQKDDVFHSVVVGMGSMGIVYSLILEVRDFYYLEERRSLCDWAILRQSLPCLLDNRHLDIYLNPYKLDGKNNCIVTWRNEVPKPEKLSEEQKHRSVKYEGASRSILLLKLLPTIVAAIRWLEIHVPIVAKVVSVEKSIEWGLSELEDECYVGVWYKVLNIGRANLIPSNSLEIAFPMRNCVKAIDRIIELAVENREKGLYHTSPLGIRFVRASKHFLAMNYEHDVCIVEFPMLVGIGEDLRNGPAVQLYRILQEELVSPAFKGRPHWGHWNSITKSDVQRMYPRFADWLATRAAFNAAGTFDNEFSKRCF